MYVLCTNRAKKCVRKSMVTYLEHIPDLCLRDPRGVLQRGSGSRHAFVSCLSRPYSMRDGPKRPLKLSKQFMPQTL